MAEPGATLALYMARDSLSTVVTALIEAGRSADTPTIAVENAGRPGARAIGCQLGDLAQRIGAAEWTGPVVVIIGEVSAMARCGETADLSPLIKTQLDSPAADMPRLFGAAAYH
jgi:uroporphyrin-III C-methyltransferase